MADVRMCEIGVILTQSKLGSESVCVVIFFCKT